MPFNETEIPGFELGNAEVPGLAAEGGSSNGSASNSRRGSEASEKMVKVEIPSEGGGASAGEDEEDDLMEDEESEFCYSVLGPSYFPPSTSTPSHPNLPRLYSPPKA